MNEKFNLGRLNSGRANDEDPALLEVKTGLKR